MNISWLGQSAFKIEFKTSTSDGTLLIDPYKHADEETPRMLSTEIALLSHGDEETITLTKEPCIVKEAGEYEYKEVLIYSFQTAHTQEAPLIFRMEIEHVTIGHLGVLAGQLDEKLLNELNGVDVLMIPVGGSNVITPERAAELITKIEPRVIIPYCFKSKGTGDDYLEVTAFTKAVGLEAETQSKFKLSKKDLPSDQMMLVLLEKQ